MSTSPASVFSHFSSKDLFTILVYRHLLTEASQDDPDNTKSNMCKQLAEHAHTTGLLKICQLLSRETLLKVGESILDGGKPSNRVLPHLIYEEMVKSTPKKWLLSQKEHLPIILEDLELEAESTDGETINSILEMADRVGIEFLLSSFSAPVLSGFAERSGLTVNTSSAEDVIECIIERKNKTKSSSEPVPKPEPSKTKPSKIGKGITLIDLNSWFLLSELIAFCEENSLSKGGSKKEVAKRIYEHLEGQVF
eukprot:TRINITY_DN6191_c0_g1_i14.p1 TRINITY_DN6191_c0_g1~~TRINITY_DN6191_c0_g1_i14.p1  ORF type:complete len:252 (-),score=43.15 TRINITY_DN6191_c0_g1_i14:211-966(-)